MVDNSIFWIPYSLASINLPPIHVYLSILESFCVWPFMTDFFSQIKSQGL